MDRWTDGQGAPDKCGCAPDKCENIIIIIITLVDFVELVIITNTHCFSARACRCLHPPTSRRTLPRRSQPIVSHHRVVDIHSDRDRDRLDRATTGSGADVDRVATDLDTVALAEGWRQH
eukprot:SAG31_NODE_4011_length_3666_cov_1.234931_2_plen_119_part_00